MTQNTHTHTTQNQAYVNTQTSTHTYTLKRIDKVSTVDKQFKNVIKITVKKKKKKWKEWKLLIKMEQGTRSIPDFFVNELKRTVWATQHRRGHDRTITTIIISYIVTVSFVPSWFGVAAINVNSKSHGKFKQLYLIQGVKITFLFYHLQNK